ncbi:hypothetical protein [Flavobacterium sp.]|jgi:hypothetical protein|uniref:glycosyltransferase n=1 Tax=Flavobacterium sp. TaxID=239 RepID=UPI002A8182FB|nr:hypothetical protein [Flavobacterium sp.]
MRIGKNPEGEKKFIDINAYHRIIIPVYIPNFEGYFKEAFEVFQLCIDSLLATVHDKTRITIYNNNCHEKVKNYIDEKFATSYVIDQVFHSKENLGKINAILAASKGNLEPIITITDADVLFKQGWQNAVEEVFCGFPEAGMVSPVPSSIAYNHYTGNNWSYAILKGKLFFDNVIDPEALVRFDESLGNVEKFYKPIHLEKYLVLRNKAKNCEAVMGCGHFVASMRREVFDKGTNQPAFIKIQHGVESKFIDMPNEELGYLRLATKNNYAFHMGNTTEAWMFEEFKALNKTLKNEAKVVSEINNSNTMSSASLFVGKLIGRLMTNKKIKRNVLRKIGLKKSSDY